MIVSRVDFSRVSLLSDKQIEAYETASALWALRGTPIARYDLSKCPATIQRGHERYVGKQCTRKAGQGTDHVGYGNCMAHGGAKQYGRALGGWLMAHAFAEELDISPWEALLYVIRITAGRVAYCQQVLSGAGSDMALEGRVRADAAPLGITTNTDGTMEVVEEKNLSWWVETSERERTLLAKVSKAAIDAGVAAMMVNNAVTEGEKIAAIMMATLDELEEAGLSDDMLDKARRIMERQLRVIDTGQQSAVTKVIDAGEGWPANPSAG